MKVQKVSRGDNLIEPYSSASLDQLAKDAVNCVHDTMFEAHRGAILWTNDIIVLFGNDGFSSDWVKLEVSNLKDILKEHGHTEIGHAVDRGGYSWVLLINTPFPRGARRPIGSKGRRRLIAKFNDCVWTAWCRVIFPDNAPDRHFIAGGIQRQIAMEVLEEVEQPVL